MDKIDIKSETLNNICDIIKKLNEPLFRAKQIYGWLYKGISGFDDMLNIPKSLRKKLDETCYIEVPTIERKLVSALDGTVKYLFGLSDGEAVEAVVMQYIHGNSICISSQVGCKMGCSFCASTTGGLIRNLTASEMLNQVEYAEKDSGKKISNIVIMGIGEPLDNYDNLLLFLKNINNPDGLNIGHRHISVSTSGICDKIYKLADEDLQITLSISLHAPNDEIRSLLMPINKKYNIKELLTACDYYVNKTHRRISYEYVLINNVNDSLDNAKELAELLKHKLCHVNLISVNEVAGKNTESCSENKVKNFQNILISKGINATIRRTLGRDINASCGQLRRSAKKD